MTNTTETVTELTSADKQDQLLDMAIAGFTKTGDVLSDFGGIATTYMEKLGPEVYELLLNVIRLEGGAELMTSLVWLALFVITVLITNKKLHPLSVRWDKRTNADGSEWIFTVFGYALSVGFLVIFINLITDIWM